MRNGIRMGTALWLAMVVIALMIGQLLTGCSTAVQAVRPVVATQSEVDPRLALCDRLDGPRTRRDRTVVVDGVTLGCF